MISGSPGPAKAAMTIRFTVISVLVKRFRGG